MTLYVDLSASMRGFLDPAYATSAFDFRRLLDTLVLRLGPEEVVGFGSTLRPMEGTLGVLGNHATYSDNYTRLEMVLAEVRADTQMTRGHVVLGDGRRSSPEESRNQFAEMSRVARWWIERGGVLVVGAALAPFRTVAMDPAGCGLSADMDTAEQRCPLYLFAFVRPGDLARLAPLVRASFEHFFVWPVPPDVRLVATRAPDAERASSAAGVQFEPRWVRMSGGQVVPRLRARDPMPGFAPLEIRASEPGEAGVSWHDAVLRQTPFTLEVSLLSLQEAGLGWRPSTETGGGGLLRLEPSDPPAISVRATGSAGQPTLLRLEAAFRAQPRWLRTLNAPDLRDPVKTLGLDLLFIGLPESPTQQGPRAFVLVN